MGGVTETDQVFANGEKCLSVMVVCVKRFNLDATMCDLRIFAKGGLMDPPLRACNMASSRSKYEGICQCLIMSFGAHRTGYLCRYRQSRRPLSEYSETLPSS